MKKQILTVFLFFTTVVNISYGQHIEPLELAKRIFDKKGFPKIGNYITGEYKGRPNGKDIKKGLITKFLLLGQENQNAVVNMTIADRTGKGVDTYLYFLKGKDSLWKMSSFRSLTMIGMATYGKDLLEKLTPSQVDSIIAVAKNDKAGSSYPMFSSKEEFEFKLGNNRLMTALDEQLITFFKANNNEFETIKELILEKKRAGIYNKEAIENDKELKASYRKVFISFVPAGDYDFHDCVELVIGGIGDNSVGYVYIPNKKNIPVMNADHIIMLREVGDGWYVYKTT